MENNFNGLLKECMENSDYKKIIQEAIVKKVIESINYNLNNSINEAVKEEFEKNYKQYVVKAVEETRDIVINRINEVLRDGIKKFAESVVFQPRSWDFDKFIKDSIKVKNE